MDRRRPLVAISALCVALAVAGAPAGAAQDTVPEPRIEVSDGPALSELPPLPAGGAAEETEDADDDTSTSERSGVQTTALALAIGALVAGGLGLALVTRRGRAEG